MSKTLKIFLSIQLCLFAWSGGALLKAQSGIYDRMGIIPGHGTHGSFSEENVDLFTGNVTLRYRDAYLPGPNGFAVEVWRTYNSKILKDRQTGSPSVQAYHQSWVGIGWSLHMGMVHSYSSNNPIIEFPDGRLEVAYADNYGVGKHEAYASVKLGKFPYPKGMACHDERAGHYWAGMMERLMIKHNPDFTACPAGVGPIGFFGGQGPHLWR